MNGLDKKIFDVEVAVSNTLGPLFKEVEKLGLPIHIFDTTTNYKPYLSLFSRINKISAFYKMNKYDIVHSWQWSSDWTEVLAAKMVGIKWIYTKKAMSWGNLHWKLKSYLAHFIVTINDEMYNYFPNKKAQQLIPLGIDSEYYNPEKFAKKFNGDESFTIITVANLVEVKGVEVLIKAIKALDDVTIKLTILGNKDNEYGRSLEKMCETFGMEKQVTFLGKKSDVRPYILDSDLYVIPTLDQGRKEGMPMALVEAMAMGIPVLGSDISGINYVLKDFPDLLFKAGDAKELAKKIIEIKRQSKKDRNILGDRLRNYCTENLTVEKFVTAHEKLYLQLLNHK